MVASQEELADLLEVRLASGAEASISLARAADYLAQLTGGTSADAELVMNHMAWRSKVAGDSYPFAIGALGARRKGTDEYSPYVQMLVLSATNSPFRGTSQGLHEAATHFERLVAPATAKLLGPGATAIRFGWPTDEGRPSDFPRAVKWLAERMGIRLGAAFRPPRRQDGGVDIVSWRAFPDARPGFPILLTQATLERDPLGKSGDIDLRLWAGYLRFDVDPSTALAVPYVIAGAETWLEVSTRTIVLDRLRLAHLLANDYVAGPAATWTAAQLNAIRETDA